jgi:hypothetical protein
MNRGLPENYQSYLLRLWRENPQGPWRASLQSTSTEQVYAFGSLDQLWAFLMSYAATDGQAPRAAESTSGLVE